MQTESYNHLFKRFELGGERVESEVAPWNRSIRELAVPVVIRESPKPNCSEVWARSIARNAAMLSKSLRTPQSR